MKAMNNRLDTSSYLTSRMDEMEWIEYRKRETKKKLNRSRSKMRESYRKMTHKEQIPTDKWGKTAYFLSRSGSIVNGIRMGYKVVRALNAVAKLKRTFSRK